jgi:hypothetical protein
LHRRQHTPHRRVVTPQTPHGMLRRSARKQNLSQDMMAETLAQANHCFSIPANTKMYQEKLQHFQRLEWHSILWSNFGLELSGPQSLLIYAWIHQSRTP